MSSFPYLGDFSGLLPYAKIIEYYKTVPAETWKEVCSALDCHTYESRPDYELNHYKNYNLGNSVYKELVVRDKEFFPDEWFSAVGALKTNYQAKIYCTTPGNTEPPHKDFFPSFLGTTKDDGSLYSQEDIDRLGKQIIRCWIPLMDHQLGHILFSEDFALYGWRKGEVYEIPSGVTHGFVNAGRSDRYVLVFTGWRSD